MLEKFYPTDDADSAYQIDYEGLARKGCRGLIFDIDNTLVPHGAPADERAKQLFGRLKGLGFACCLLSNNKEGRVEMFNGEIGAYSICKAGKPSPGGYQRAMELMGTDKDSTVFIGDQIFTDIYGANLAGIPSILVKPIHPKEEIQIVLKRYLEKPILWAYRRRKRRGRERL